MLAQADGIIKFAEVGGIKVRYRVRGNGPPLFCIHGLLGSIEQEDAMAGGKARLVEQYTVVHYDGRGRGKSEAGGFETWRYTWEGLAGDLYDLMKHLGISRARFIGGSQGAAVALALAINRPEAVAAMVLHYPPEIRALDPKYVAGMLDYAAYIEREGMDAVTDLILNLPPNDQLRKTHPRLIEGYDKIMRAQDARVVAAATRGTALSAPMTREQLNAITAPTLVVGTEGDGLHPSEVAKFILDCVPNAERLIGNTLTYLSDNPDVTPRRILEFLSKVDGVRWD